MYFVFNVIIFFRSFIKKVLWLLGIRFYIVWIDKFLEFNFIYFWYILFDINVKILRNVIKMGLNIIIVFVIYGLMIFKKFDNLLEMLNV